MMPSRPSETSFIHDSSQMRHTPTVRNIIEDVRRLCTKSGIDLPTEGPAGPRVVHARTAQVLCLDTNLEPYALAFATLTKRTYALLDTSLDLSECLPEIIFLAAGSASASLLQEMNRFQRKATPGLMLFPTFGEVIPQLAQSVINWMSFTSPRIAAVLVGRDATLLDDAETFVGKDWSQYQKSSFKELGQPGALLVTAHSDGVDSRLGTTTVLCARKSVHETKQRPSGKVLRCISTNYCHRKQTSVPIALQDKSIISVNELQAGVLVLATCFGLITQEDAAHNYDDSILRQIVQRGVAGAIITLAGPTYVSTQILLLLISFIAKGTPVGEVVAKVNSSPLAENSGVQFILVGEPTSRVKHRDWPSISQELDFEPPASLAIKQAPPSEVGSAVYAIACWRGLHEGQPSEGQRPLTPLAYAEGVMSKYGTSGAALLEHWIPDWKPSGPGPGRNCNMCADRRQTSTIKFQWRKLNGVIRYVSVCGECGVSRDAPESWNGPEVALRRNYLHLEWPSESSPLDVKVIIKSQSPSEMNSIPWPQRSGQPTESMEIPATKFSGMLEIGVAIRQNAEIAVFTRRLHSEMFRPPCDDIT